MKRVKVAIPPELVRSGLTWGRGDGRLYAYAKTAADLRGVPDQIEGVAVVKRVTGVIRPAAG
jgi:hypothetical protein